MILAPLTLIFSESLWKMQDLVYILEGVAPTLGRLALNLFSKFTNFSFKKLFWGPHGTLKRASTFLKNNSFRKIFQKKMFLAPGGPGRRNPFEHLNLILCIFNKLSKI